MRKSGKEFPKGPPGPEKCTVLSVSATEDDVLSLRRILDARWTVRHAATCDEASRLLENEMPAVIACENALPDGTWKDLFHLATRLADPPPMVVVSQHADESLWAEVLNLGGYDVLAKPFEPTEVSRVMAMASRHGRAIAAH